MFSTSLRAFDLEGQNHGLGIFVVKRGEPNLTVLITCLLLVLEVCNVKPSYRKSCAGNLLMCSDLTLGPSFKVKRVQPNLKMRITHLLLALEVCSVKPTFRKSWVGNLLMFSDLTLGPSRPGQTGIARLKSAYNRLIIGPRGLRCETNL